MRAVSRSVTVSWASDYPTHLKIAALLFAPYISAAQKGGSEFYGPHMATTETGQTANCFTA